MKKQPYWSNKDLVVIGSFAAMIKIISFLIALAGGGMNPLTLVIKNVVATALLIVLVCHIRKFGIVMLYVAISVAFSMITMGRGMMIAPGMIIAALLTDMLIYILGGYSSTFAIVIGIAIFDLLSRTVSLAIGFLFMREAPQMIFVAAIFVAVGYIGCLIGLPAGIRLVKERQHAGVIRE